MKDLKTAVIQMRDLQKRLELARRRKEGKAWDELLWQVKEAEAVVDELLKPEGSNQEELFIP